MSQADIITLVANIINGIGLFFVALSMAFKRKKSIIFCQAINQVFSGIAYTMLGGISGLMLCIVTLTMDIFIFFDKQTKILSIIFATLTFVLGTIGVVISGVQAYNGLVAKVNSGEFEASRIAAKMIVEISISYFPVIGTTAYNIFTLRRNTSMFVLRLSFLISCLLWAIFSYYIKSYVGAAFNAFAILVNIVKSIIIKRDEIRQNEYANQVARMHETVTTDESLIDSAREGSDVIFDFDPSEAKTKE
jgi:hypothetical protein